MVGGVWWGGGGRGKGERVGSGGGMGEGGGLKLRDQGQAVGWGRGTCEDPQEQARLTGPRTFFHRYLGYWESLGLRYGWPWCSRA